MKKLHDELIIRSDIRSTDGPIVSDLVRATGFFNSEEEAVARELVDERLTNGEASGYEFHFAERHGRVLGYSCFGHISGTRSSYDLYWLVVDPSSQKQGLGQRLLRAVEFEVAQRGGGGVYVETSGRTLYDGTRRFYVQAGYQERARFEHFYDTHDAKVVYVKLIESSQSQSRANPLSTAG